jgi:very-short-patch-repair endonuclease
VKPLTLTSIARHRHGLVPLDIAVDAGISRSAWYRLLASGRLEAVHPGVARLPGAPVTRDQRILAAVLACGPGAAASHRSAAYLWGAGADDDDPVDVILPPSRKGPSLPGVVVHRPRDAARLSTVRRRQIPCVNVLRTVVDHAVVVDADRLAVSLDRLVVSRLLSVGTLRTALAQHRKRGRPGVRALDEVLRMWSMGEKPPDSVLEPAMALLLVRHGLPLFAFHHVAATAEGRFELDFARVAERVDVEVDGWEAHGTPRAFQADRRRDALLTAEGWVVQRFTWFQVRRQPDWVAQRIRHCLANRIALVG